MRARTCLLLLSVACLTGCATKSIVVSAPPVPKTMLERCPDVIAEPLTVADQYDTARALAQATGAYRTCAARQAALAEAVELRESVTRSVKQQLER